MMIANNLPIGLSKVNGIPTDGTLNIKTEFDDIPVFYDIFLTFNA